MPRTLRQLDQQHLIHAGAPVRWPDPQPPVVRSRVARVLQDNGWRLWQGHLLLDLGVDQVERVARTARHELDVPVDVEPDHRALGLTVTLIAVSEKHAAEQMLDLGDDLLGGVTPLGAGLSLRRL